jgi:hypothetical protein
MLVARSVGIELYYPDLMARRYVQYQLSESRKLGYPIAASFAKNIANGTLSPAPTPDDPALDLVGVFMWELTEIKRRLIFSAYGDTDSPYLRARRLGMTLSRFNLSKREILFQLKGRLTPIQIAV